MGMENQAIAEEYDSLEVKQVDAIELRVQGRKWAEIERELDLHRSTLYDWRTNDLTFMAALDKRIEEEKSDAIAATRRITALQRDVAIKGLESLNAVATGMAPNDARQMADSAIKNTRLIEGESTDNQSHAVVVREITPERRAQIRKRLSEGNWEE